MVEMNIRIKPCPFCGGNAKAISYEKDNWHIACDNNVECAIMPLTPTAKTMEEAIAVWNNRWDSDKALELCGKALEVINRQDHLIDRLVEEFYQLCDITMTPEDFKACISVIVKGNAEPEQGDGWTQEGRW